VWSCPISTSGLKSDGRNGEDGQPSSSCQISWRSVKPSLRYCDFSIFPRWRLSAILDLWCACLDTRKGHLVVFVTVQNLVRIDTAVSTVLGLKTPIHAPKIVVFLRGELQIWCDVDPQRTSSYFWRLLPLCHFWQKWIKKCDHESADRQTDTLWQRQIEFISVLCCML